MDGATEDRDEGPGGGSRPFPDWRGRTVVVAASGPSQRKEDIEAARGKAVVLVINETWRLAPWADALYACDVNWWRLRGPSEADFAGLRFIGSGEWAGCVPCGVDTSRPRMQWDGKRLGSGRNSGFQAVNLAAAAGASRIVLLGFDMGAAEGRKHWHADHAGGLVNPSDRLLEDCAARLDAAAPELRARGVEVINASRETALRAYERAPIREALGKARDGVVDDAARQAEHEKYLRAYGMNADYRMGAARMADAVKDLKALPCRGSYLDVSCGRGEMLYRAAALGFGPVSGTEIVPDLIDGERVFRAEVHALPFEDGAFDVVSMFDVIEHLIPGDDEAACREMQRVARRHILLTANNRPSFNKAGDDLHINKRPYEEWDRLFRQWFTGKVIWLDGHKYVSEGWRIDL